MQDKAADREELQRCLERVTSATTPAELIEAVKIAHMKCEEYMSKYLPGTGEMKGEQGCLANKRKSS